MDLPRRSLWDKLRMTSRLEVIALAALIILVIGYFMIRAAGRPEFLQFGTLSPVTPAQPKGAAAITGDLLLEEYPVVERSIDQPTHFEFNNRIPAAVREKRAAWKSRPTPYNNAELANAALTPFGWRLEPAEGTAEGTFRLLKGIELVAARIYEFGPVAVSDDGKAFALVADIPGRGSVLIGPEGIRSFDFMGHLFQRPVYAGNELVTVRSKGDDPTMFEVLKDDKVVYTGLMGPTMVELPLKRLGVWNGQWVVELRHQLLVGGESLNEHLGYEEIFDWRMLDGKPFFFFKDNGTYGIWYDGHPLGISYDEIIHYACCEPAAFNPGGNDLVVTFYARRGEMWHYVEVGAYR